MEKEANYFVVGVFVTVSLLALVGFTIWLAGGHGFADYDRYTVHFTDPVGSLNEDGPVKYKGVDVGKILALRLSPDHPDVIKVDIEVRAGTPVRASSSAKIQMQGIAGQTYIDLETQDLGGKPPEHVAGDPYPVLKGTGSEFAKFLDDLPELSRRLQSTLSALTDFSRSATRTSDSIKGVADVLKEDPSRIIRGPSNKGVEIPK